MLLNFAYIMYESHCVHHIVCVTLFVSNCVGQIMWVTLCGSHFVKGVKWSKVRGVNWFKYCDAHGCATLKKRLISVYKLQLSQDFLDFLFQNCP